MENEPIFAEERQNKIISMLKLHNKLLVNDLCEMFGVSPATIRNDLNQLEKRGQLKRTHGGAIPITKAGFEPTSIQKDDTNRSQKEKIAALAAGFIENGDTIAIDTGTTALKLAEQLADKQNVKVVTTDIRIACLLENYDGVNVVLVGGTVRKGFSCTVGSATTDVLNRLCVDKAFVATNSVTPSGELCTPDIEQASVKRKLIEMATQVILICDSTKFGTQSFAKFGTMEDVDIIVTDDSIDEKILEKIREFNSDIEVIK